MLYCVQQAAVLRAAVCVTSSKIQLASKWCRTMDWCEHSAELWPVGVDFAAHAAQDAFDQLLDCNTTHTLRATGLHVTRQRDYMRQPLNLGQWPPYNHSGTICQSDPVNAQTLTYSLPCSIDAYIPGVHGSGHCHCQRHLSGSLANRAVLLT